MRKIKNKKAWIARIFFENTPLGRQFLKGHRNNANDEGTLYMKKGNAVHIGIILLVLTTISLNVLMILGSVMNPILYTRDYVMMPGIRAFIEALKAVEKFHG